MKKMLLITVCSAYLAGCGVQMEAALNAPNVMTATHSNSEPPPNLGDYLPSGKFSLNLQFNETLSVNKKISYSEQDLDNFVRTMVTEVGFQNDEEIKWATNVVINRYLSGNYGKTISDVVKNCSLVTKITTKYVKTGKKNKRHKKITVVSRHTVCQFSVWNKYDNSYSIVSTNRVYNHPRYELVKTIVVNELTNRENNGKDPSDGCTHYFHPKAMIPAGRTPVWAIRAIKYRIGDGVFVKMRDSATNSY